MKTEIQTSTIKLDHPINGYSELHRSLHYVDGNLRRVVIAFSAEELKLSNAAPVMLDALTTLEKGHGFAHVQDVPSMIEKAANILEIKATNEGGKSYLVDPILRVAQKIRKAIRLATE